MAIAFGWTAIVDLRKLFSWSGRMGKNLSTEFKKEMKFLSQVLSTSSAKEKLPELGRVVLNKLDFSHRASTAVGGLKKAVLGQGRRH